MVSKFLFNFCSTASVFTKSRASELIQRLGVNYLSHVSLDSSILNHAEVQKYLKYIQSDETYVRNKISSQNKNFTEVVELIEKKKDIENKIKNLLNISLEDDEELDRLIEEEKSDYLKEIENINIDILENIIPHENENDDNNNLEIQIIPAIGGAEALLFGELLYQMYMQFIEYKNWECKGCHLKDMKSDAKNSFILVSGDCAYEYLKNEAGVHRVQRVPETEKMGRTHTSTCSVVILPRPKLNKIVISSKDLQVEKMRSSGPGGQNVNKRETCVRIKHIPTGVVVENQTSRFQTENYNIAVERLTGILHNAEKQKILLEKKNLKKEQAGTNDYSDKIRTYNFTKQRITDHRINHTVHNTKGFMSGGKELDEMIKKLLVFSKKNYLLDQISETFQTIEYKDFVKKNASRI